MRKRGNQMAKRVHSVSLKGQLHSDNVVEEFNKIDGEEVSQFFDLAEVLKAFHGKSITISIKEEAPLPTLEG